MNDTGALSEGLRAAEEIVRTLHTLYDGFVRNFERSGVSPLTFFQCWCLDVMRRRGPLPMSEAAESFSISKQQMTRFADEMEARGLVQKRLSPDDRRVIILSLTRAGEQALDTHLDMMTAEQAERVSRLTPVEARELLECAARFRELLEKYWG